MSLIKLLQIFFVILILILFPFGIINYSGNIIYYLVFTLVSSYSLLVSFGKNSIAFETFFGLLLWLGFWFKFTIQISFLNSLFPEGAGIFDFKPDSFDNILKISTISIIAFLSAKMFRSKFIFKYKNFKSEEYENTSCFRFYYKKRKLILLIYLTTIFVISIINYKYVFFQKGTVPETILPFGLNNFINWLLMFGLTSLSSLIIFFEFFYKKKNSNKILKFGLIETFTSSISILSRAMIFNGTALIYGFYKLVDSSKIKIKKKKFINFFLILIILFTSSLFLVSKLRQSKDFPVGHEVQKYIPQIETKSDNKIVTSLNTTINSTTREINQILFLIAGRWVGIEGIMAVSSSDEKGYELFINSFYDKFDYSNSYYENKIKKSKHSYENNPKIYTVYVPGIVAFLLYANSMLFLFFGIFLLCIICSYIEFLSFRLSLNNVIFSTVMGNVLAYRLAHFGYMPQNTYKFFLSVIFTITIAYIFLNLINKIKLK